MKTHRLNLTEKLNNCSVNAKALFLFLCAERLRSCCWAFQEQQSVDFTAYFHWSNVVFKVLQGALEFDVNEASKGMQDLESIVPTSGEPLAVQAQSGVLCLLWALELLSGESVDGVIDAVNAIVDALDNYVFFVQGWLKKDTSGPPSRYPLLVREMDRQLADAAFVKAFDQITPNGLIEYRIENLQFVIPIAA